MRNKSQAESRARRKNRVGHIGFEYAGRVGNAEAGRHGAPGTQHDEPRLQSALGVVDPVGVLLGLPVTRRGWLEKEPASSVTCLVRAQMAAQTAGCDSSQPINDMPLPSNTPEQTGAQTAAG